MENSYLINLVRAAQSKEWQLRSQSLTLKVTIVLRQTWRTVHIINIDTANDDDSLISLIITFILTKNTDASVTVDEELLLCMKQHLEHNKCWFKDEEQKASQFEEFKELQCVFQTK